MSQLLEDVRGLLGRVRGELTEPEDVAEIEAVTSRLDAPLRVAFAGRVKAGKSTLLNALVGEELAPTDAGECTRIVTWYGDGHTYRVLLHLLDGTSRQARFHRDEGALDVDLGDLEAGQVERIEVTWPSSRLRDLTLIDTPGLGSATEDASAPTLRFLALDAAEDNASEADAVIYLMRHMHQADLGFLEAFHDDSFAGANPVNTIAVLARADEVGACKPEAMATARRIANRYRDDPRLRRLCQTVVPVAGLLAQASVTLTEQEYRALARLAQLPRDEADALMLTVDRFVSDETVEVTPIEREHLLDRLGVYGVRTAIRLIRHRAAGSATELALLLRELSGIDELRTQLTDLFGRRRDLLKSRAALTALDGVLRRQPPGSADHLVVELERIMASAHEFTELQVVSAIRNGSIPLRDHEVAELDRLLDQPGASLAQRLGISAPEGDPDRDATVRAAAIETIDRWRRRAEHPMSTRPAVHVANTVIRSVEGEMARLSASDH